MRRRPRRRTDGPTGRPPAGAPGAPAVAALRRGRRRGLPVIRNRPLPCAGR
jgi:hypothetical protein